jgi:hypothetical protein
MRMEVEILVNEVSKVRAALMESRVCSRKKEVIAEIGLLVSNASPKLWALAQDFSFYKYSTGCIHIEL